MTTTTTETKTTKAPTLYTIGSEMDALRDLLEGDDAGTTEADAEVVAQWMAEFDGALETKLSRCIAYIREQEAMADARALEARRLRELAEIPVARVKRLKEAIRFVFEGQGLKRVETNLGNVTLAANGGKQPIEVLVTVDDLPSDCVRVVREPDLDAIRKRIESGEAITFARALPRGSHVRIR